MNDFYTLPSGSRVRLSELAGAADLSEVKVYKPGMQLGLALPFVPAVQVDPADIRGFLLVGVGAIGIGISVIGAIAQGRAISREPKMIYKAALLLGTIGSTIGALAYFGLAAGGLLGSHKTVENPLLNPTM